jgi:hypothetical protein
MSYNATLVQMHVNDIVVLSLWFDNHREAVDFAHSERDRLQLDHPGQKVYYTFCKGTR